MVFKTFGVHSVASALHYLRAYHLDDVLKRTTQEDVELTLLNTPAFEKFDKKKGVFFYREAPVVVEPVVAEAPAVEERPAVVLTPEEMALAEAAAETAEPIDEVEAAEAGVVLEDLGKTVLAALAPEKKPREEEKKPVAPPAVPPKKEKEKKKIKIDTDRRPKTRKSERRVLEEEFIDKQSEREALYAVKEAEDDILAELGVDLPGLEPEDEAAAPIEAKTTPAASKAKPKAEIKIEAEEAPEEAAAEEEAEAPPTGGAPAAGGMFGGIFANKLKAALKKKREEGPTEDETEGGAPPANENPEK